MAAFTAIQDMSKPSLILTSLREIGYHFCQQSHYQAAAKPLLFSICEKDYKKAVDVLYPLAYYLQRVAEDDNKEILGEMLAESEVLDQLCEGILHPFIKEISLQEQREIMHTHALQLILLLHVCLMECSVSSRMKRKLVECGCIFLLLKELRNMVRTINSDDAESNKFSRQLIQSATLVVNNCLLENIDLFMRLHPDIDIEGSFTSYFKYPDPIVRLVCQITYYHFSFYLHQVHPGSIDSQGNIINYCQLLSIASKDKNFAAMVDRLVLDATDLMKILRCLCTSAANRKFLIESSDFHSAINCFLLSKGEKEIECALDLLLTYLTEGQPTTKSKKRGKVEQMSVQDSREQARRELLHYFPEFISHLGRIMAHQHKGIKQLGSSLLWYLQADPDGDIQSCLRYVECCYEHKHFGECCYWNDYIGELCAVNSEAKKFRDQFLLYKAKAKYRIYQLHHVVLRRAESLQNLGEIKQDREKVYESTKEVISILGSLKAKHFSLDYASEQFLDYSLMDYIREVNKRASKDSVYCMLCHKKQPMVRSHTVPESLLKLVFKNTREEKIFLMGASGLSLDSQVKTVHTMTFNMLCNVCDNEVLSRDENHFIEKVAKPVYQTSPISHLEKIDKIIYGEWLYRFCAGIIFRNLALSRGIAGSTNTDDIHKLFHYCRSVVSRSDQADVASKLSACSIKSVDNEKVEVSDKKFQFAIFFTPGMMPEDHLSQQKGETSNLVRSLNSNVFFRLSNISTAGVSTRFIKKHYFFAAHFGIFTVVAFLEPLPMKYHQFLIDPHCGELNIPANTNRLDLIPPGLLQLFNDHAETTVQHYLESMVEEDQGKRNVSLTVLKSNVAQCSMGEPTSFNLLPPKYKLDRTTNVITMMEGHSILLHHTVQFPSASHTVFLAVEDVSPAKPYVIIHSYLTEPVMSQTFGYFVSLPEFAFKAELDACHEVLMKHIREKDLDLFKLPSKFIPTLLECAGLHSYQSILYHFNRNPVFDKKCVPGRGCWYCCRKCDVCMLDSTAGLSFSTKSDEESQEPTALRFHDEQCKAFHYRSREFPSSLTLTKPLKAVKLYLIPEGNEEEISREILGLHLLSITFSSFDELLNSPTLAAIDIYRVTEGNAEIPFGCFVTLFDVKRCGNRTFAEFFLTLEFQLERPLPHMTSVIAGECIQMINDVIREAMQLNDLDVSSVHSLSIQQAGNQPQEVNSDDNDCDQLIGLDF